MAASHPDIQTKGRPQASRPACRVELVEVCDGDFKLSRMMQVKGQGFKGSLIQVINLTSTIPTIKS
jgi:hypothetical protein